jgi:hypothetical protein
MSSLHASPENIWLCFNASKKIKKMFFRLPEQDRDITKTIVRGGNFPRAAKN